MNQLYSIFNPQYINQGFVYQTPQQRYQEEQEREIQKAIKAIHDYCDASRRIAPEYRQYALEKCIEAFLIEMNKNCG